MWVDVSYGEDGDPAWDLYEVNGFVRTISRGRSKTAQYEFVGEDKESLNDLVIEVTASFDHNSAFFEGAAN